MAHTYKVTLPKGWIVTGKKRTDIDCQIATLVAVGVQYTEQGALVFLDGAGDIVKAYAPDMWKTLHREVTPEDNHWIASWGQESNNTPPDKPEKKTRKKGGEPNG